jgi:hypothetical protein
MRFHLFCFSIIAPFSFFENPSFYWGEKFNEGIINQDFATNSRELSFAKTQQKCKHGKGNHFIHIWLRWCIGKLEIRESVIPRSEKVELKPLYVCP